MKNTFGLITSLAMAACLAAPVSADIFSTAQLQQAPQTSPQGGEPDTPPTPENAPEQKKPLAKALAAQQKLDGLIKMMDSEAVRNGNSWQFTLSERQIFVITDTAADRMRVMSPIANAAGLSGNLLERMLQANYDAALDARYAIAQNVVWSVFVHPLISLEEKDFLSGTAQTVVAAQTYGTTFSSGMFVYGGGDTNGIHRQLLEDLKKRTQSTL